ncbi:tetratricopeptide repeat protein [Mucilaginibacter calamicampi]|uniref:Oxygen sensor histidine kinase NreB n=1 Tax=Mucilaginibacter calamicampi TaxID=1302352 RepID=A0ABW2Z0L4_9SPHI
MKRFITFILLVPLCAFPQSRRIDSLRTVLANTGTDTAKCQIYYLLAIELLTMAPAEAEKVMAVSKRIAVKEGYNPGMAYVFSFNAIQANYKGDYAGSKNNAEKALAISLKYKLGPIEAIAKNTLGIYYWQTGNYAQAVEMHLAALKVRERLNDSVGISKSLGNLGQVYLDNEKYKEAEYYALQGLALCKKLKENYVTINCLHILANINAAQKKYQRALAFDREALPLCLADNNKRGLSQIYSNMANCYEAMNDLEKARQYQMKVLESDKYFESKKWISDTYLNIGRLFWREAKYEQATDWLNRSLELSVATDSKKGQRDAWKMLENVLEKRGKYKEALVAYQNYQAINEDIINEGNDKEIALMQTNYETQKKEQKITLLNRENTIQKLSIAKQKTTLGIVAGSAVALLGFAGLLYNRNQNKQKIILQDHKLEQRAELTRAVIEAEEKERTRIASDLHDGVGQLFSAVKMNLNGLIERVDMPRDEDRFLAEKTLALVEESCKEVRHISHQMMPNMLLKSGIASDVKSFIEKIDSEKLKVKVEANGFKDKLESNVETVLYRVIQEAVNNVIKHSRATLLNIKLDREATGISVAITDNGVGFDPAVAEASGGIGLKNITARVDYLKGTVDYRSAPGAGTSIKVWVPV